MPTYLTGPLLIREPDAPLAAGEVVDGHAHLFDHVTYCPRGGIRVDWLSAPDTNDVLRTVTLWSTSMPNWVLIEAEHYHRLTALADDTIYHCLYPHRDPETGEIVKTYTGWEDATR